MKNSQLNQVSLESIARSLASIAVSLESRALREANTKQDLINLQEAYQEAQDALDIEYVDLI